MIVFLRSNDANPDPRLQKYLDYCDHKSIKYHVFAWDRLGEGISDCDRYTYYHKKSAFGNGLSNGLNIIKWNIFLLRKLYKIRKEIKLVHSCDLDTGLIGSIIKSFGVKFIYDIFDWYGDSRGGRLRIIFNVIERLVVRISDHTIICDQGRIKQIGFTPKQFSVFPNIPSNITEDKVVKCTEVIEIAYVGILTKDRHLDFVLRFAKYVDKSNLDIRITVAGFGELENEILKTAKSCNCLSYKGKVSYTEAQSIISKSDLMFAFYDIKVKNNIFAAPNKFYESLALATPLITNVGTLLSDKVRYCNTGYLVINLEDDFESLICEFSQDDINTKKLKCKQLWDDKYKNFVHNYLSTTYQDILED